MLKPSLSMNTAQFAVAVSCIFAVLSAAVILTVTTLSAGTYLPSFLVCLLVVYLEHVTIQFVDHPCFVRGTPDWGGSR
ncbi:hypothetical protein [Brevibacillus fortis]|uniref:hypothetical protein n=1 Tax=Brevibacillus fortis TaxID=2126352 RepID=UPI001FC9F546|nr:hypothetical protein [Brevibacillus fortis]